MKDHQVLFRSTRGDRENVDASSAILRGLAPDGGLYVPDHLPRFTRTMRDFAQMSYQECAYEVMRMLLTDFSDRELKASVTAAYDEKFDTRAIAPVMCCGNAYFLELWHGATMAFKDMALSILPYLMTCAAHRKKEDKEIVILTATSGDTGKAALAGFADVPGTRIVVFYPKDGVSPTQERQMVTQAGDNVHVIGVDGNFDDAQNGVKALFTDEALIGRMSEAGYRFSSANSINIGRLVPQIVYYVYAYAKLLREGEIGNGYEVNICVPTGNFGNILAAYYAQWMGLPVRKFLCASNSNKVLFDFFQTGVYDRNRAFILTDSPSMDILISSNLERLIYHITGDDAEKDAALMKRLVREGRYEISAQMKEELQRFHGGYASEEACAQAIRDAYDEYGYLIDTHTAVGYAVHKQYVKETGDDTATIIASTASPYKFTRAVLNALDNKPMREGAGKEDDFALAERLSKKTGTQIPAPFEALRNAKVRHKDTCDVDGMKASLKRILSL
ncbi:MAG: threonine synthase [Lachnospiraceae bacterium]|nr:threonine synthase [Lachnospiraceae bacterium]